MSFQNSSRFRFRRARLGIQALALVAILQSATLAGAEIAHFGQGQGWMWDPGNYWTSADGNAYTTYGFLTQSYADTTVYLGDYVVPSYGAYDYFSSITPTVDSLYIQGNSTANTGINFDFRPYIPGNPNSQAYTYGSLTVNQDLNVYATYDVSVHMFSPIVTVLGNTNIGSNYYGLHQKTQFTLDGYQTDPWSQQPITGYSTNNFNCENTALSLLNGARFSATNFNLGTQFGEFSDSSSIHATGGAVFTASSLTTSSTGDFQVKFDSNSQANIGSIYLQAGLTGQASSFTVDNHSTLTTQSMAIADSTLPNTGNTINLTINNGSAVNFANPATDGLTVQSEFQEKDINVLGGSQLNLGSLDPYTTLWTLGTIKLTAGGDGQIKFLTDGVGSSVTGNLNIQTGYGYVGSNSGWDGQVDMRFTNGAALYGNISENVGQNGSANITFDNANWYGNVYQGFLQDWSYLNGSGQKSLTFTNGAQGVGNLYIESGSLTIDNGASLTNSFAGLRNGATMRVASGGHFQGTIDNIDSSLTVAKDGVVSDSYIGIGYMTPGAMKAENGSKFYNDQLEIVNSGKATPVVLQGADSYFGFNKIDVGGYKDNSQDGIPGTILYPSALSVQNGAVVYIGKQVSENGTEVTPSRPSLAVFKGSDLYVDGSSSVVVGNPASAVTPVGGEVSVYTDGYVYGTGNIHANLDNVSGHVNPGTSIGTLHLLGDYTQTGGDLQFEVGSASYDVLDATGAIDITGGTITITGYEGFQLKGTETLQFFTGFSSLEIDPSVQFILDPGVHLSGFNPNTGTFTLASAAVPGPSSLLVFALGALATRRRRS